MNALPVDPNDPAAVRAWAAEVHALVLRMQTGERRALEALYDRTRHVVYGLALRVTGDPAAAEEAALEAYQSAYRNAWTYEPAPAGAVAWLLHLARAAALARVAAVKRTPTPAPVTDEDPVADERRRARAVVGSLPEAQRRVLEIAYFEGAAPESIAERLQLPADDVRRQIGEAVAALRARLEAP